MDPQVLWDESENYDSESENSECLASELHNAITSLKQLCLGTIIHHFERFNSAFLTSQDENLQGNIYFLRRGYSHGILRALQKNGEFNNSHMNFLLNEYLRELDVGNLIYYGSTTIQKKICEIGHSLAAVNFNTICTYIFNKDTFANPCITHLSNVKSLRISSGCTNETVRIIIASCPKLEELHVSFWDRPEFDSVFSEGGVKYLCPVENDVPQPNRTLRKLIFSTYSNASIPVTESDLVFLLENLPCLETISHPLLPNVLCQMHQQDLTNTALGSVKKYNLTSIDLLLKGTTLTPTVTEVLSVCSKVCPSLKQLKTLVSGDRDIEHISLFTELESLKIVGVKPGIDLEGFMKLRGSKLKEFVIFRFSISVDVLIQSCQNLEYLCLSSVDLRTDDAVAERKSLQRMRKLNLQRYYNIGVRGPINVILNACPNLEKLVFTNSRLMSMINIPKFIKAASVLKKITFRKCWVNPVLLCSILVNCSSLKTLILMYSKNLDYDIDDVLFRFLPCKRQCLKIIYCDWRDYIVTSDSEDEDKYDY